MKKAVLPLALTLILLCAPLAHADDYDRSTISPPLGSNGDADAKIAYKAKYYLQMEALRAQMFAKIVVMHDGCVAGGHIPPGVVSGETRYNMYIDKEKVRRDAARPQIVEDWQVVEALRKTLSDVKTRFQRVKAMFDENHCQLISRTWDQTLKKYNVE